MWKRSLCVWGCTAVLDTGCWISGCVLPAPGAGFGDSWLWGHPLALHTTRCLSHYQRTAWRGLSSSAPRSADPYIVGPLYPPSMDNVGFEGTSLMLLWGLSPHPFQGSRTPPTSLRARGWVISPALLPPCSKHSYLPAPPLPCRSHPFLSHLSLGNSPFFPYSLFSSFLLGCRCRPPAPKDQSLICGAGYGGSPQR